MHRNQRGRANFHPYRRGGGRGAGVVRGYDHGPVISQYLSCFNHDPPTQADPIDLLMENPWTGFSEVEGKCKVSTLPPRHPGNPR